MGDCMNEMKTCTKCKRELSVDMFTKNKSSKDGFHNQCKECRKKYYEKHKEQRAEYDKQYHEKHKEHYKEYNKRYRKENEEYFKIYRKENKEYIKERNKRYCQKNKEHIKKYRNRHDKERRETDALYKLKFDVRKNINEAFRRKGYKKSSKASKILGIDFEGLKKYLYSTWLDNYGTEYNGEAYHIDHIIPLATANSEEDVMRLCHYTNLQLLKPEDNLKKSDSLEWEINYA
jgi:hypothetical protein